VTAVAGLHVVATTVSGSIRDWAKVERIIPLFQEHGRRDVTLHVVESHADARARAADVVAGGCRHVISAGGSGTFNAVLEGCLDSGVGPEDVSLGFLRKGSADLIGKVLGMPDDIREAVAVFAESLVVGATVPCDIIRVESGEGDVPARHLVGYGGAGIFGRIPHFTENRFMKLYKGVLGQLFGDLGPFGVGASLAALETTLTRPFRGQRTWRVVVDGEERARGRYQALVLVNGDLGPNLPFARGAPLGSGDFHLFGMKDLGALRMIGQFRRAFAGTIDEDPERSGFQGWRVTRTLELAPDDGRPFPVNRDGSTYPCRGVARFRIVGQVKLMSRAASAGRP
jgi:diacylglycerol kinase family enzyme